jgi:hypothetical protein
VWTLADVPNMAHWWRLDVGVTTVSGFVSNVDDQFASTPLIQGTALDRPTYLATGLNGGPAMKGDMVTKHMTAHAAAALFGTAYSFYTVVEYDSIGSGPKLWGAGHSTGTGETYDRQLTGPKRRIVQVDDAGATISGTGTFAIDTTARIYWTRYDGSNIWIGHDAVVETAGAAMSPAAAVTMNRFAVLAKYTSSMLGPIDAIFAEGALYSAKTSDADHALILADIKSRWGTP